jgi:two-component system, response regulator
MSHLIDNFIEQILSLSGLSITMEPVERRALETRVPNESRSFFAEQMLHPRLATARAMGMRMILIVACTDEDARSTHEMLRSIWVENPIEILPDADELLSYLKRERKLARDAPHLSPSLILLDLSNKHDSSFALLRWLHCHFGKFEIPIAALPGKDNMDQVTRAYQLGVRTFLRKPLSPSEFRAMTDTLKIPIVYSLKTETARFEKAKASQTLRCARPDR